MPLRWTLFSILLRWLPSFKVVTHALGARMFWGQGGF